MDEITTIVVLLIAIFALAINDPDVTAAEIQEATEICQERGGIKYIKTTVDDGYVHGKCVDGLKFKRWFKEK